MKTYLSLIIMASLGLQLYFIADIFSVCWGVGSMHPPALVPSLVPSSLLVLFVLLVGIAVVVYITRRARRPLPVSPEFVFPPLPDPAPALPDYPYDDYDGIQDQLINEAMRRKVRVSQSRVRRGRGRRGRND